MKSVAVIIFSFLKTGTFSYYFKFDDTYTYTSNIVSENVFTQNPSSLVLVFTVYVNEYDEN